MPDTTPPAARPRVAVMPELTWKDTGHGRNGYAGYLGRIHAFDVYWRRSGETPWELRCYLPGFLGKRWQAASYEAGKARAVPVLAAWLLAAGLQGVPSGE